MTVKNVAIVTGAAQGMGYEVFHALAARGYVTIGIDIQKEKLQKVKEIVEQDNVAVEIFGADVSDSTRVNEIIDQVYKTYGSIDVLVNAAGVLSQGEVTTLSDEDWERTFAVNTTGVFHISRAVCNRMKENQQGAVVTISSNAASVPRTSMSAYCASKAASLMFTKCLGLEMASYGIRCNIVSPGATDTEMQRAFWNEEADIEKGIKGIPEQYRVGIPLQKIANTSDITEAVLFLLSENARHITMNNIVVDGGATLGAQ
ncbi:2,3-dihydro-2,3-dihydroxybenzoate dehydrogenase [Oceanobacillus sp. 1P07AA]|uniref:2,3-dihydro-2,3-dihydroxybenzoate dehydrogenase n=1 Tax=Oceanobacillus sp. 1P07AA TaxID=3132293 RepID=UPI0039A4E87F